MILKLVCKPGRPIFEESKVAFRKSAYISSQIAEDVLAKSFISIYSVLWCKNDALRYPRKADSLEAQKQQLELSRCLDI
jgi:hypothetical protein